MRRKRVLQVSKESFSFFRGALSFPGAVTSVLPLSHQGASPAPIEDLSRGRGRARTPSLTPSINRRGSPLRLFASAEVPVSLNDCPP